MRNRPLGLAIVVFTLLSCLSLPARPQAPLQPSTEWEAVRRATYVSAMTAKIQEDPRLYLKIQEAVVEHEVGLLNRSSLLDRSRPLLSDYVYYGGKALWNLWKSEEVDLALRVGSLGSGSAAGGIGRNVAYLREFRDASLSAEKLYIKWSKEEAARFVAARGQDIQIVLGEAYDIGVREARRGTTNRTNASPPLFIARLNEAARDYGSVRPTDSDESLLSAAPPGYIAKKILSEFKKLSATQQREIAESRDKLRAFFEEKVGGLIEVNTALREEVAGVDSKLAAVAEAAERQEERARIQARRAEYENQWTEARGGLQLVVASAQIFDPETAQVIDRGGTSLLMMSRATSDMLADGASAAAMGNFLSGAVTFASLFKSPKADPMAKYLAEQFELIRIRLQQIIQALVVLDSRMEILQRTQDAGFAAVLAKLSGLSEEINAFHQTFSENERQRVLGEASAVYTRCLDQLQNKNFNLLETDSRSRYHDCLHAAMNVAVTRASELWQTSTMPADRIEKAGVIVDEVLSPAFFAYTENYTSLVNFAARYSATAQNLSEPQSLRVASSGYSQFVPGTASAFNAKAWALGVRTVLDLRLGVPDYAPTPVSPSSSYFTTLAEMGIWLDGQVRLVTSDASVRAAVRAFQTNARDAAVAMEKIVSVGLREKFPSYYYTKKNTGPLTDYFDIPTNVFLGFNQDEAWRDNGFHLDRPKDTVFLASILGLLDEEVTQVQTEGGRAEVKAGYRSCYKTTRQLYLKGKKGIDAARVGVQSVESCAVASGSGNIGLMSITGVNTNNRKLSDEYAKRWFLRDFLSFDAVEAPFSAKTSLITDRLSESYSTDVHKELKPLVREAAAKVSSNILQESFSKDATRAATRRSEFFTVYFAPANRAAVVLATALALKRGSCVYVNPKARQLFAKVFDRSTSGPDGDFFDGSKTIASYVTRAELSNGSQVGRMTPAPRTAKNATKHQTLIDAVTERQKRADPSDLLAEMEVEFDNPADAHLYGLCQSDGVPALRAGLGYLRVWDAWVTFVAHRK